ncbi:MAG: thiol:disulfide interchange protein [Phenylobacterium zucineum]|nr:MAG: thiol:disulfide interchange protein [Phenylobacterium zucineum]
MSQDQEEKIKPRANPLKWALWSVAGIGIAVSLYIIGQAAINPLQEMGLKRLAKGEMAKMILPTSAGAPPATSFLDGTGNQKRIADFRGKVTVVNIWATWCGPCVLEMPTLDKLAEAYKNKPVAVVTVSLDGERQKDRAFAFMSKFANLDFYRDPKMKLPYDLIPPTSAMPTTVIYGKDGVEKGRIMGPADWSGPDARAVIDKLLAE